MMNKKNSFSIIFCFFLLVLSGTIFSQSNNNDGSTVNKVVVMVTLPDTTTFKATVVENEYLIITGNGRTYKFTPIVTDVKNNIAEMQPVEIYDKIAGNVLFQKNSSPIHFNILEVISVSVKKFNEMASNSSGCVDGRCCATCGDFTACACAVEFAMCSYCCCDPCCTPIE